MREKLHTELISSIHDIVDTDTLRVISSIIEAGLNRYEISERCTDLVLIDYIPNPVKNYLVSMKIEGKSDTTINRYTYILKHFFGSVNKPVEGVNKSECKIYLYDYQRVRGVSNRTLDSIRIVLNTFFTWCVNEEIINRNPMSNIKAIKYPKRERGYLSDVEIELIRDACDDPRERAIFELLYSTGCRVSEIINIKKSDIDWINDRLKVIGKGSKERIVYLNARSKLMLHKYLESRVDRSEYLIVSKKKPHGNLTKRAVEIIIADLGKRAGIERPVYPHLIRHSTASHAIQRGMDVTEIQRMLGHSNVDTTMIYANISENSVQNSHHRCIV